MYTCDQALDLPPSRTVTGLHQRLLETLDSEGVAYCLWKGSYYWQHGSAPGAGGLDLLVARDAAGGFESIVAELGFKRALDTSGGVIPSVLHYCGWDAGAAQFVHLHVYYRIIVGGKLLNTHSFPMERLLLDRCHRVHGMPVPDASAELVVLVVRKMLRRASLTEWLLARGREAQRRNDNMRLQLDTLRESSSRAERSKVLAEGLPCVDEALLESCIAVLAGEAPLFRAARLARRLSRQVSPYGRLSGFTAALLLPLRVLQRAWWHVVGRSGKRLASGGAVIAVVGADATGKSTVLSHCSRWLGEALEVKMVHAGKPPATWLTLPFMTGLVVMRRARRFRRRGEGRPAAGDAHQPASAFGPVSLAHAVRAVVLAWERRRLLLRARRLAAHGGLVLCDRYPSDTPGAMDSPRLRVDLVAAGVAATIRNRLARIEAHLYKEIPPPDVVLRLSVSIDTAKHRNRSRGEAKREDEAYLESRHRLNVPWRKPGTGYVYDISADGTLAETVRKAQEAIWQSI